MKDDGGSAFPKLNYEGNPNTGYNVIQREQGMSLRDYFAAKAMQAILSDPNVTDIDKVLKAGPQQYYAIADAMLAERNKP